MHRNITLFAVFANLLFAANINAQDYNCKYYFISVNNIKYCSNNIIYEKQVYKPIILKSDKISLSPDSIKFFNSVKGYFANTRQVNSSGLSQFAERVEVGRVNLYTYTTEYYNVQTGPGSISKFYVNKGEGDIYKAKVKNLKKLLSDDPESMKQLRKVSTFRWVAGTIGLAGFTAGIIGSVPFFKETNDAVMNDPDKTVRPNPLMISGFSIALAANFSFFLCPSPYKAIRIYNSKK